ncbi:hypothetical protein F5888DRAFT_1576951, partial [Russula emetica]
QARNILLRIEDPTVLEDVEENEIKEPSSRKITELTTIFDFGEARTGKESCKGLIQPVVYRAREVFL